ncbi:purine-nucleoside phosphorylase [Desulfurivibrio alkaliphilus]|uniref:Purine nucleoside phosphorylase n=1 Tax=Desulfurivibrio alkaliphilus (strain DSM 19089 / UNIQEM U267 / AHT2) TaxID=589865 RepID=D6Z194_DESAT|nr:purine-nucleoside phosphorylase [Desulfurivibrio alkaliphilus]ADH85349.1 purine nucleoside phosphorylase I, inosine and guanosine-specific [Desulfurivibrio alkaliphilus AHT 2]
MDSSDNKSKAANFIQRVEAAREFLLSRLPVTPEVVLILGTGLGGVAELVEEAVVLPYAEIPYFPRSTVPSHAGNLVCGRLAGRPVAVLQGRFHYYEGYSTRELTMPLRVLSRLGAGMLLTTGCAGGLNPGYAPGTLMLLRDHLNLIPDNPLRGSNNDEWGERFPDLSSAYDPELRRLARQCATGLGIDRLREGVYVAVPGPSLETPAETRYLRQCGADAVGMSVVPEVIVARHAGLRVLGLAVVANVNDPDNQQPILLDEIIRETEACAKQVQELVLALLQRL